MNESLQNVHTFWNMKKKKRKKNERKTNEKRMKKWNEKMKKKKTEMKNRLNVNYRRLTSKKSSNSKEKAKNKRIKCAYRNVLNESIFRPEIAKRLFGESLKWTRVCVCVCALAKSRWKKLQSDKIIWRISCNGLIVIIKNCVKMKWFDSGEREAFQ